MNDVMLEAFSDELAKMAGLKDWWHGLLHTLGIRSKSPEDEKVQHRVDYLFSPKAGKDKWDKFAKNVRDPKFVRAVASHPEADARLVLHAKSMHEMSRGKTIDKIQSSRLPGRTYEVRETPSGLACTCPDWRFKGSVTPGYKCKHIKAHEAGKMKA